MNPIEFSRSQPCKAIETAVEKIQELSAHPWGNSVTLENIEKLFEAHLDHIISQAMKQENLRSLILEPLKKLPSLLCARFGRSGKDVAFRVLGGALSLEPATSTLPVLPKDVLQKIFSEMVRENYRTIRQVSRLWKECADSAWKDLIREQWVAPVHYEGVRQMFGAAKRLDLRGMKETQILELLKLYPELQGLKLLNLVGSVENSYLKITDLIIKRTKIELQEYNLSAFEHLKSFEIKYMLSSNLRFPPSIEKVIFKKCGNVDHDFHDTISLKKLKFLWCSMVRINLRSPGYQSLESLIVSRGHTLLNINWPRSMDHLIDLCIRSISEDAGTNFSHVAFPQLKNLVIEALRVRLPPAHLVPNLDFLAIVFNFYEGWPSVEGGLSLEWYSKLRELVLGGLALECVILPESIEFIIIERCSRLTKLVLPEEPHRLKSIVLKEVSLNEIDLSRYTNLETITISTHVECHLILGEHSPKPVVYSKVHVTYGSKKKRKVKGG